MWRPRKSKALLTFAVALGAALSGSQTAFAVNPIDPHWAAGPTTAQQPLTTAAGVAPELWGYGCLPPQGVSSAVPVQAPDSYAKVLAQAALGRTVTDGVVQAAQDAMGFAYAAYIAGRPDHTPPPPPLTFLPEALGIVKDRILGAVSSQATWESLIARYGTLNRPASADPEQFLARAADFEGNLRLAGDCDSKDGTRLYRSGQTNAEHLFALGPDGSWAAVRPGPGSVLPTGFTTYKAIPGKPRTYVISRRVASPVFGPDLYQEQGELSLDPSVDVHSCEVDGADLTNVNLQIGASVYDALNTIAPWFPPLPSLTKLGGLAPLSFQATCATVGATFLPYSNGPVYGGPLQLSDNGAVAAAFTVVNGSQVVARWTRTGPIWGPAEPFASLTYNQAGDPVIPQVAVSGDGNTVAGCDLVGPVPASRFPALVDAAYHPPRFPEIFNFATGDVSYPRDGTPDPQACGSVSLDTAGGTVWWSQGGTTPGWFSSGTRPVTLVDGIPPTLTGPATVTVEATGPAGAPVTLPQVTATDDVDGVVPTLCVVPGSRVSGDTFPIGTATVVCTARDAAGNTGTLSYGVTVQDTTAPVFGGLPDRTVEATGPSGAVVDLTVVARDTVDGPVRAACSAGLPAGTAFPLGARVVTCIATDQAGNTSSASFSVNVTDTTPPRVTVPNDFTVDATSPTGAVVTWQATAVDLVDGPVEVTCTPASGTMEPIGVSVVSCSAADSRGNQAAQQVFSVTVRSATQQLTALAQNVPSGGGFPQQVAAAQRALAKGDLPGARGALGAVANHAQAQSGKDLTVAAATALKAAALRIRDVIG